MIIRQKIGATILAGLLYWILLKIVVKLGNLLNVDVFLVGIFIVDILPIISGALLLLFFRERKYTRIIYCVFFVFVYYIVDLTENILRISSVYNPIKETFFLFERVGVYSLFFSVLGGLLGVYINKRQLKKREEENNSGDIISDLELRKHS